MVIHTAYFIDELNAKHAISNFESITLGMCGAKLVQSYNNVCDENMQLKTTKSILFRFFNFIHDLSGITNHQLMEKLKK